MTIPCNFAITYLNKLLNGQFSKSFLRKYKLQQVHPLNPNRAAFTFQSKNLVKNKAFHFDNMLNLDITVNKICFPFSQFAICVTCLVYLRNAESFSIIKIFTYQF